MIGRTRNSRALCKQPCMHWI